MNRDCLFFVLWVTFWSMVAIALCGCSATKQIGNAAREAQTKAAAAHGKIDAAIATGEVGTKAEPILRDAQEDIADIEILAVGISDRVQSGAVVDAEGWFSKLLKWGAVFVVIFFLLYFMPFIKPIIVWIGAKIGIKSKATVLQAKADAEWEKDTAPIDQTDRARIEAIAKAKEDPAYRLTLESELKAPTGAVA